MRVISGRLGGRSFDSPGGHRTHPMGDKIRGALFNMLGDIEGLTVADLYSGSGAIAIEAISRGAAHVTAIDSDKVANATIKRNVEALGLDEDIKVHKIFVRSWLHRTNDQFDVVIVDPPYDDLHFKTLDNLHEAVKPNGVIVYSLPPNTRLLMPANVVKMSEKSYGDATLVFYRKVS